VIRTKKRIRAGFASLRPFQTAKLAMIPLRFKITASCRFEGAVRFRGPNRDVVDVMVEDRLKNTLPSGPCSRFPRDSLAKDKGRLQNEASQRKGERKGSVWRSHLNSRTHFG